MTIPSCLHFCWIGPRLPWACAFAVISAARQGGLDEVVVHHTDALEDDDALRAVLRAPGVRLSRTEPMDRLAAAGQTLGLGDALARLYERLGPPAMRSDVLRAAILHDEGGLYLDTDTVTVACLRPLLDATQFVGSERIVWPQWARESRSPAVLARHLALDVARKAMRQAPGGWRAFRRVEALYPHAVNNAAMGAQAGAPLMAACLRAMAAMPEARLAQRTALGPALLQRVVAGQEAGSVVVHPPGVFSPLPPEISEHWFRTARRVRLDSALLPETRAVHWYASVRTAALAGRIGPEYVAQNRGRQLYSALVDACVAGGQGAREQDARSAEAFGRRVGP